MMNDVFHYPPDLFELIVQVIPLLNRSKDSVILFFKGAGVDENLYRDIALQIKNDKDSITKYAICRNILERINENTDKYLRVRREIVKRIVEFEAFSTCWPDDQLKAKGLVAEIQKIVNVRDSFTRMKDEKNREKNKHTNEYECKISTLQKWKENLSTIKNELYALFSETNPQKRGKALESVLNKFFRAYGILIKEDFKRNGELGEGVIEQIDGVIEFENKIFLVEMKWTQDKIGTDISSHLVRMYHRGDTSGFYISASGYTLSALSIAKEALVKGALFVLFDLEEFVHILEREVDFNQYVKKKIEAAIVEKDPYKKCS